MGSNPIQRAKIALGVKTDTALAKSLGVGQSVVGGYNRRQTVPLEQCIKIAERTGVSLDWLVLGKGDIGNTDAVNSVAYVPLYDVPASAGYGSFFDSEHIIQQIPFDFKWIHKEGLSAKELVCLPIKGDSMHPNLIDGDVVLVNRSVTSGDGIFVIRMGEVLRVKRLQWLVDGSIRISSDNPLYDSEVITPKSVADQFEIIGMCHTKIGRVR